jgi:hypothetical protein
VLCLSSDARSNAGVPTEAFHKLLRGEDLASVKGQRGEQAALGWFQGDGLPANRHLLLNKVNMEGAEPPTVAAGVPPFARPGSDQMRE